MMNSNTFNLRINPHTETHVSTVTPGVTYHIHRSDVLVDASWSFADGVKIHIRENATYKTTYTYGVSYRARPDRETIRPDRKARVFVDGGQRFNALEDLTNRTRRPHTAWKQPTLEALARIGLHPTKAHWNQRAGCGCGCSPGFVLDGVPEARRFDIWVTLPDAPTVDETKPARQLVGV